MDWGATIVDAPFTPWTEISGVHASRDRARALLPYPLNTTEVCMRARHWLATLGVMVGVFGGAVGCADASTAEVADLEDDLGSTSAALTVSGASIVAWDAVLFNVDPSPFSARALTIMHLAQFDAVNSIYRRFEPYRFLLDAPAGASAEAAAVGAAYSVLITRYGANPTAAAAIEAQRTASLAAIPDGQGKTDGFALGQSIGTQLFVSRANDNYSLPNPVYQPGTGPDAYQLTPPGFANPLNQNAALWTPFGLESAGQFRGNGPPHITGKKFAAEYNEVKTIGVACAAPPAPCPRTPDQSAAAQFFVELPVNQLFRLARQVATAESTSLYRAARFFALLSVAASDATQSAFETKYFYNFVRPITAIRNGENDGNSRTDGDPTWNSALVAPPHPEYPSAHAVIQYAMIQVFERFYGCHYSFDLNSASLPTAPPRHFESFEAVGELGQEARIWGGIHFRSAVEEGARQGTKVGRYINRNLLKRAY